jgi:hypothetical protein
MLPFEYHRASADEIEQFGRAFCEQHGDDARGLIACTEYDRLFDNLAEALSRYGTFTEGSGEADFSGYRYVDQVPWIAIVPRYTAKPCVALSAALEAISTSHRPLAVSFDYYPEELLILPPNCVYTTLDLSAFAQGE